MIMLLQNQKRPLWAILLSTFQSLVLNQPILVRDFRFFCANTYIVPKKW